jgi:hypothetical protein
LKRATPSFTVEHRQTKRRQHSGGAELDRVDANWVPTSPKETTRRIAISVFKTASTEKPAGVAVPSIPSGRILPSLAETEPSTVPHGDVVRSRKAEHPTDEGAKSNFHGAGHTSAAPTNQSATRRLGEAISRRGRTKVEEADAPDRQDDLSDAPVAPADRSSELPAVSEPSSTVRKDRILRRYVFRDELRPGESWKRKIERRRERRV